jgi:cytosolic carboxypeptidase protein 5
MEGVIDFLTNKQDLRAHLLRKMFVFMIVPMINVDGVFHGHFRMDTFGRNLNRFYIKPDRHQQPAIYAIKALASHLIADSRLSFYFDLHAHNAKKGCFIYGNAFSDFVEQVESQVFCKLFSINHSGFEYEYCNFTEKHMNAKDRF